MAFTNQIQRISELVVDLLRTADPPNPRWELVTSGLANQLRAFTGLGTEQDAAHLSVLSSNAGGIDHGWIEILAPKLSAVVGAFITVMSQSNGFTQVTIGSGGINDVELKVQAASTGANSLNTGVFIQGSGVGGLNISGLPDYDTGWIAPALVNGWTNFGGGHDPVGYRRINGVTYVRGLIAGGLLNAAGGAFTLPAGFRAAGTTKMFGVVDGSNTANGRLDISGGSVVQPVTGNNAFFSLACSFPADA